MNDFLTGASSAPLPTLLIVDDEAPNIKALCHTLEPAGYHVVGCTSPQEALVNLRCGRIDVLLTDLVMPEMDGITLLRAAKEVDPALVAVIMTGHGTVSTAVEAMRNGALDYILKPFKLSAILPVLARALEIRRLRRENSELVVSLRERAGELARLNEELEERVEQRTRDLQLALVEKTGLLQEVHHRVRNNLQVICSLLSMQLGCCRGRSAAGDIRDAYARVWTMALIQEQLHQKSELSASDFKDCIRAISGNLLNSEVDRRRIRLEFQVDLVPISIEQAIPAGLILNELVANAVEHAFRKSQEGTIGVCLRKIAPERAELSVTDNGNGMPPELSIEKANSLGFKIVRALAAQLRAQLRVERAGGTAVTFDWELG